MENAKKSCTVERGQDCGLVSRTLTSGEMCLVWHYTENCDKTTIGPTASPAFRLYCLHFSMRPGGSNTSSKVMCESGSKRWACLQSKTAYSSDFQHLVFFRSPGEALEDSSDPDSCPKDSHSSALGWGLGSEIHFLQNLPRRFYHAASLMTVIDPRPSSWPQLYARIAQAALKRT